MDSTTTEPHTGGNNGYRLARPIAVQPLGSGYVVEHDNGTRDFYDTLEQPWGPPGTDSHAYYQQLLQLLQVATDDTQPAAAKPSDTQPAAAPVVFIDADDDDGPVTYAGEWAPDEEGRIWLASGQGEYTLLAGLPGYGKSHLAQEFAARERETGGHPLAILPEASDSWRNRNRQLPPDARVHIVAGLPNLEALRTALEERAEAGKAWPTMVIVDPATLVVAEWANARSESATYSYPTVAAAVAKLEAATVSPDGNRPKLVWCVHTPETENGGRNRRAVGGYTQAAGCAYLLPSVGKVTVLKRPRDCPEDLPDKAMLYTRVDGRIRFAGLGTGKGEHRGKRDRNTDRRRIREVIVQAGTLGATQRQVIQLLPGIGRVTAASVLTDLVEAGEAETYEEPGVNGKPITRYRTTARPVENQPFRLPDEPPF